MRRTHRYVLLIAASAAIVGANSITVLASAAPGLGTATSFAILAGSTVTNTGNTLISGNLGVSPGTAVTGFYLPGQISNGAQHTGADALAVSAKNDLTRRMASQRRQPAISTRPARISGPRPSAPAPIVRPPRRR
jgi:type VI secretion system secreted protein VgrG